MVGGDKILESRVCAGQRLIFSGRRQDPSMAHSTRGVNEGLLVRVQPEEQSHRSEAVSSYGDGASRVLVAVRVAVHRQRATDTTPGAARFASWLTWA
jgi:hypothetical protein